MKTLNDLREYAKAKEMNERDIERLINEVESDGNGVEVLFKNILFMYFAGKKVY